MEKLLAYCGLDCSTCDARRATLADDNALRAAVAEKWSKEYNFAFSPSMINCTGCTAQGAKIGHCGDCAMRYCGAGRSVENCGVCVEYGSCAKIGEFLAMVPAAKANLEAFRGGV